MTVGVLAAVVWGVGVSLYAFVQGPQWLEWFGALLGGVAVCLAAPPLLLAAGSRLRLHVVRRQR